MTCYLSVYISAARTGSRKPYHRIVSNNPFSALYPTSFMTLPQSPFSTTSPPRTFLSSLTLYLIWLDHFISFSKIVYLWTSGSSPTNVVTTHLATTNSWKIPSHLATTNPYFSWKISHYRHHANTGSLEHDEVYAPKSKSEIVTTSFRYLDNPIGQTLTLLVKLTLGWYIYLSVNAAGRPYNKFASYYDPRSPIFSDNERVLIVLSDFGILTFGYLLYNLGLAQGFGWLLCVYGGALMVMNAFLVTIDHLPPPYSSFLAAL